MWAVVQLGNRVLGGMACLECFRRNGRLRGCRPAVVAGRARANSMHLSATPGKKNDHGHCCRHVPRGAEVAERVRIAGLQSAVHEATVAAAFDLLPAIRTLHWRGRGASHVSREAPGKLYNRKASQMGNGHCRQLEHEESRHLLNLATSSRLTTGSMMVKAIELPSQHPTVMYGDQDSVNVL